MTRGEQVNSVFRASGKEVFSVRLTDLLLRVCDIKGTGVPLLSCPTLKNPVTTCNCFVHIIIFICKEPMGNEIKSIPSKSVMFLYL